MIMLVNWIWVICVIEGLFINVMFVQVNVIVEVEEVKWFFFGDFGVFFKFEVSNWYYFLFFKCWFGLYIVLVLMLLVVYFVWFIKVDEVF